MIKNALLALVVISGTLASCSSSNDENDERKAVKIEKKNDTALLLCSFGSTYSQPQETYDKIIADFEREFPNTDIYMSFTSRTIVSRVYAKLKKEYVQPDIWFKALADAKYEKVMVQSLHIIPGSEYVSLMDTYAYKGFMASHPDTKVARGACLLKSDNDVKAVAKVLYNYYKPNLDQGEVVAFMGHGNPEDEYIHANNRYMQLQNELQKLSGKKNIFIGTVDWDKLMFGNVRDGIIAYAKSRGLTEATYKDQVVTLAPLMSIAGDHAQNDMLGGLEDGQTEASIDPFEPDFVVQANGKIEFTSEYTWIVKLKKLGFSINPTGSTIDPAKFSVIGLGDHKELRDIWVNHLKEAEFETWNEIFE